MIVALKHGNKMFVNSTATRLSHDLLQCALLLLGNSTYHKTID